MALLLIDCKNADLDTVLTEIIIMNLYILQSNTKDFSSFIQRYNAVDEMSIISRACNQRWHSFGSDYNPVLLNLQASDSRKKNYNFDISSSLKPFYIFSEKAMCILEDVLKTRGDFLEVITESKQKKFVGYYPTNVLKNCFCKKTSIFKEYEKGLFINTPALIEKNITDEYLFTIEEDVSRVFVTDKFKAMVEKNNLLGFDFSVKIANI